MWTWDKTDATSDGSKEPDAQNAVELSGTVADVNRMARASMETNHPHNAHGRSPRVSSEEYRRQSNHEEKRVGIGVRNRVEEQLIIIMEDCTKKKNMYWSFAYRLELYDKLLTIPLIVVSGATTAIASANLGVIRSITHSSNSEEVTCELSVVDWFSITMMVASAVVSIGYGVQKTSKFAERAEVCKAIAKRFSVLSVRIDITLDYYRSNAHGEWNKNRLARFAQEVFHEVQSLTREAPDLPQEELGAKVNIDGHGNITFGKLRRFFRSPPSDSTNDSVV